MIGITVGVIASCLAPGGACGENRAMTVTPPSTPVCRTDRVTRRLSRDYGVVKKGPVEAGAFRGPTAVMYGGVTRLGPPMRDTRKRILKFNLTLQKNWGAPATFRIVRVDTGRPAYWSGPRGDDRYTGYAVRLAKRPGEVTGLGAGIIVPGAGCYLFEMRSAGKVVRIHFLVPDAREPLPSNWSPAPT